jgi:carbon storage regulator CsrA
MERKRLTLNTKRRGRLVITRKHMQSVDIGNTRVTLIQDKDGIKLAIEAPRHVHILRTELKKHDKPTSTH